jgi:hypothetical protein
MNYEKEVKEHTHAIIKKAEAFLINRLKELGLPESIVRETPKRITRQDYRDRPDYFQYYLDIDSPSAQLLMCEIVRAEYDSTNHKFYICQYIDKEPILFVKPTYE